MNWFSKALSFAVVASLGACGGGGGGGDKEDGSPSVPPRGGTSVVTSIALSGTATYEFVPNVLGGLSYSASTAKPIRGALVEVVNEAGAIVANAHTDAAGAYLVSVPSNISVLVRVKAHLIQDPSGSAPSWDVTVRDNTQEDAIYALETPVFALGSTAVVRNVDAKSGWNGTAYSASRAAAPFAILDTIYTTQSKVLSVAASTTFPPLRVFWSVNNLPASGNPALGEIGGTSFTGSAAGYAIYVLGKENVNTDEYDASVIAHEWGHYYQSAFSRDDSPGGSHSLADRLDRRVAFSEGWGNAWSGIALGQSFYADSVGPAQAQGSRIDLAAGSLGTRGWYSENSVQSILWNLNKQLGFKPIHDTFTGLLKSTAAVTSIHSFAATFAATAPAGASVLSGLLSGQNITAALNDPFGSSETNDGGLAEALPMYGLATVGGSTRACVTYRAGTPNKLGNYVYVRFTAPTTRAYQIVVEGASGTDPDFSVFNSRLVATADGIGITETSRVDLASGESVLAIHDFNNSLASPCFTVTIQ